MQPEKIIQPINQPDEGSSPHLVNSRPTTPEQANQPVTVLSPDELDKADKLAQQAANDKLASSLLGEISQKERDKLIANSIGSQVGTIQSTSYYEAQVADQVGFPYYTFFLIAIGLGLLGWKFEWIDSVESIVVYGAGLYFIYLWLRHWLAHRKRK